MKLIIAIIHDEDNDRVSRMLTGENFRVTMIASTGGFLRSGRSTLLIGRRRKIYPVEFYRRRSMVEMNKPHGKLVMM